ncbi:Holliday junction branch migration protein RuvA [Croceimicrobium sp.]|uniref:Holliday junction branch migration protein RuvA n=1 Tax=Croceimicrobium sp. TaxID=2828340 RepID=UPI003BAD8F35
MLHHIRGKLIEVKPTEAIIDCQGLGYQVNISLNTYSAIAHQQELMLFLHPIYKEDSQTLYGFSSKQERDVFVHLISVSGVGGNTARTILSSLSPLEVIAGIGREDVALLQSVKGIGAKTAQRVIIDLKDKLASLAEEVDVAGHNPGLKAEAIAALEVLGYPARQSERVLSKLLQDPAISSIEELIKAALKKL